MAFVSSTSPEDYPHTVISHLSVGDHALDEEGFQRTMKYIFTFVEKVPQQLSLLYSCNH